MGTSPAPPRLGAGRGKEEEIGLRAAQYSSVRFVEMGLMLEHPVRLSEVGWRYVGRFTQW
jgi:hypothetical protein